MPYQLILLFLLLLPTRFTQQNNIVYETVHQKVRQIKGQVIGFDSNKLLVFATPYLKAFSLKTKGLVDFEVKSSVKNNQFKLDFLDEKKEYLVGAFIDQNRNGLLDIRSESFYFAEQNDQSILIRKSNHRSVKFHILEVDDSKDLGIKVLDSDNRLLFTRQFSSAKFVLKNLPLHSKIKVYSTSHMEDLAISLYEEGLIYDISSYPQNSFSIIYDQEWTAMDLNINYNQEKYYLLLKNLSSQKTKMLTMYQFYDMPLDSYQISMHSKVSQEEVLKAPIFHHPSKIALDFEFSKDYFLQLHENVKQKKCKVYKRDLLLYQGGCPSKLELMQAGHYSILLFDKYPRKVRKLNKWLVKNFESFDFELNRNSKNILISSQRPSYKEKELYIQLHQPITKGNKEGQLLLFQKKDNEEYIHLIHRTPMNTSSKDALLTAKISLDPEQLLYLHFDFNSDFQIDDFEEEYIRGFTWKDLEHTLALAIVKEGYLILSAKLAQKTKYFVTVSS
ncbi:hypothetical protein MJH12_16045, partial [bacterium]|nr:hypothetical protein [bacterium]